MLNSFYSRSRIRQVNRLFALFQAITPMALSLCLTLFLYWRSVRVLKDYSDVVLSAIQFKARDLYTYSLSQLILFGPSILCSIIRIYTITDLGFLSGIAPISLGLAGFINCSVYFFQRRCSTQENSQINMECLEKIANDRDSVANLLYKEGHSFATPRMTFAKNYVDSRSSSIDTRNSTEGYNSMEL